METVTQRAIKRTARRQGDCGSARRDVSPQETAPEPTIRWFVCHTRPRCEKRFADILQRQTFEYYLPLVNSVLRYKSGIKRFRKPLFPSYVFARIPLERKSCIYQDNYLVRTLPIESENLFLSQIEQVRSLVSSGFELTVCPTLRKGTRVKILTGPLAGVDALVEDPGDPEHIIISLDILQQGIRVRVPQVNLSVEEE